MSVDEILAEYNDILAAMPAAAEAIGAEREAEEARGSRLPAEPEPPKAAEPPRGRSGGRVSRMEEEARDMLQQMRSDSFASAAQMGGNRPGGRARERRG